MKINSTNQISFQKKLVATAGYLLKNEPKKCNIYQLEREKDKNYFVKHFDTIWEKADYFDCAEEEWMDAQDDIRKYYTLESSNGRCLAIAVVDEFNSFMDYLDLFVVKPSYAHAREDRISKYIGETMLTALANITKKKNDKEVFYVMCPVKKAYKFYNEKCGFKKTEGSALFADTDVIDNLNAQNERHTKSKIEILA